MNDEPKIRMVSTLVQVWEDMPEFGRRDSRAHGRDFRRRIQGPLTRFLRRRGWMVTDDPRIMKHYRSLRASHRRAVKGELHAKIESSGRCFSIELYQEKYNVTHPHGGFYEHDKRQKMPPLLRRRLDLEMAKITAFLASTLGYPVQDERHLHETADQRLARSYRECSHTDPALGRARFANGDRDRMGADGALLEHGQTAWAYDRKGRLLRGTAFYSLNNMWWLRLNRFDHRHYSSHELLTSCPGTPRAKKNDKAHLNRLRLALGAATAAGDFPRVVGLQRLLMPVSTSTAPKTYLLRRKQCGSWWKPDSRGYTNTFLRAGLYTRAEAESVAGHGEVEAIPVESIRSEILEAFAQAVQVAGALAPASVARGAA